MKNFSVRSVVPNCPWLLCLVSVGFEKLGFLLCWFYNHRNFPHFGDCASQHYLGGKLDTLIFCSDNSPTTILRSGKYWFLHCLVSQTLRIFMLVSSWETEVQSIWRWQCWKKRNLPNLVIIFFILAPWKTMDRQQIARVCQRIRDRVPLIAQSWNPGLEEVETQGGNGRAREGEREKCCFCLQNDLKEP